jgi:hypothetical protein
MIDAKELRIGNYIKYAESKDLSKKFHNTFVEVNIDILLDVDNVIRKNWFTHIPLTTEILVKCGFNKELVVGKSDKFFYSLNGLSYNECHVAWWYRGVLDFQIKYLHQLQNLYYALAGKELEYQP